MFSSPWVGSKAKATSHKNWLVRESTCNKEKKNKIKPYTFNAASTTWKYCDQELTVDEIKYSLYQHRIWRKLGRQHEWKKLTRLVVVATAVGKERGRKWWDWEDERKLRKKNRVFERRVKEERERLNFLQNKKEL